MRRGPAKLAWTGGLGVGGKSSHIPSRAGLYAYGIVKRSLGLPSQIEWVYVGQARNLRQRISSHDHRFESNPGLQAWLRNPPAHAELWIVEVPADQLNELEREVIQSISPKFNRNHNQQKHEGD